MAFTLHRERIEVNPPDPWTCSGRALTGNTPVSIKIRATEEILAARTAQLALFVVEFVTAARAPAPVFALGLTPSGVLNRRGIR
jgi:hypothetical protein